MTAISRKKIQTIKPVKHKTYKSTSRAMPLKVQGDTLSDRGQLYIPSRRKR